MQKEILSAWLSVSTIAVDIETRTKALPHYPQVVHRIKSFGLSALAPITDIALYNPDLGSLVFDMRGYDPYTGEMDKATEEAWNFIYEVLCRPDLLIIGHNVLFDLRGIGVQHNKMFAEPEFRLPLGLKVWDTEIIAKRMLLGEAFSKHSSFRDDFDILSLAERLEVAVPELWEAAMIMWMKTQRADLSNLVVTLTELPTDHSIWGYLGGYIPPNRSDLLQEAATKLITDYVAFDAKIAYQIYEKELDIAKRLAEGNVKFGKYHLVKYPELTQRDIHPEFASLLDYWTRYLRLAANRTIKGLRVNLRHLKAEQQKARQILLENERILAQSRDAHDPYPDFEKVIAQMFYVEMLLGKLAESAGQTTKKTTFSSKIQDEWYFWRNLQLSPLVMRDAIDFHESHSEEDIQEWLLYLSANVYSHYPTARKEAPKSRVPTIDLFAWVKRNCYSGYEEPHASLLAKCKLVWLREYFTIRRAELRAAATKYYVLHPAKTKTDDEAILKDGERLFRERMTNSKKWIPYYLFCISNAPLPSSYNLRYQEGMLTGATNRTLELYRKDNGGDPEDLQNFIIQEHLKGQALSYGKKALDFYLNNEDYAEGTAQLTPLRTLMQARADINRLREFQQHAAFDGRIHSLFRPDAKTGRNKSANPNLQNIKMKQGTPYPGLFIAPKDYWLSSADFTNQEIGLNNMLGKDDAGAFAREDNDFHATTAAEYWPDLFPTLVGKERKAWRNLAKRINFSTLYGAGIIKTALALRCSPEEAKRVLDNKKRFFWRTEEQKKFIIGNAQKRFEAGVLPVFVALWSKERVQVDRFRKDGHVGIVGYPTWNYVIQGGATAMLRRADVLISEMLEREGHKTFIQMDIHDELLFAIHKDEYEGDLLPRCLALMSSIVPEEYLERTTPKTHFIAEFGPENHIKWGYRSDKQYPWALDHFITQWGKFPLDEETMAKPPAEREALAWIGPKHLGWTLDMETEALQAKRRLQSVLDKADDKDSGTLVSSSPWLDLQLLLSQMETNRFILELLQPRELIFEGKDGKMNSSGLLPFSAWMTASQALYHRGKHSTYCDALQQVRVTLMETGGDAATWLAQHEAVFKVLPNA